MRTPSMSLSMKRTAAITKLLRLLAIGLVLAPAPAQAQNEEVIDHHTDAIGLGARHDRRDRGRGGALRLCAVWRRVAAGAADPESGRPTVCGERARRGDRARRFWARATPLPRAIRAFHDCRPSFESRCRIVRSTKMEPVRLRARTTRSYSSTRTVRDHAAADLPATSIHSASRYHDECFDKNNCPNGPRNDSFAGDT